MKVHILKDSDLLKAAKDGRITAWGHGANCFGVMGAGISGHVMRMFPGVYQADVKNPEPSNARLGHFSYHIDPNGVIGANLYTQFQPGKDARLPTINNSLTEFCEFLSTIDEKANYTLGIPALGCGIGGLSLRSLVASLCEIPKPEASIDLILFLRPGEFIEEVYQIEQAFIDVKHPDVAFYQTLDEYEEKKCTHPKS